MLEWMRAHALGRKTLALADRPVWIRISGIDGRIRGRVVQHASYYLTSTGPEPAIAHTFQRLVQAAGIQFFVDVGANIGYYGFLAASRNRNLRCVLVEPDSANLQLLRATLATHDYAPRMQLVEAALGSKSGTQTLYRDTLTGHKGSLLPGQGLIGGATTPVTTLDLLLRDVEYGEVCIKIDVEGGEEEVLAGADETLSRRRPYLILECFHSRTDESAFHSLEQRYSYVCYDATDPRRPITSSTTNYLAVPIEKRSSIVALWGPAAA